MAALIATHPAERIEDAIADVLPRLNGAFSIVVMTKDRVVAFRDPHGLRPLALGCSRRSLHDRPCGGERTVAPHRATGVADGEPALLRRQRVVRV